MSGSARAKPKLTRRTLARAGLGLLLPIVLGLSLPAGLGAQSEGAASTGMERATGQVHRTIRRAGRGPLPRAVHGVRLGATTAAVAGSGFRPGSPAAPGSATFAPPVAGKPGRPFSAGGILLGLPRHLVYGPLVVYTERSPYPVRGPGDYGAAAPGRSAETGATHYRPLPPEPEPPLPSAREAPQGTCALATVRLESGPTRRLRIATGPLGALTIGEARGRLEKRLRSDRPLVLWGWDGSGLLVPAGRTREIDLAPCPGRAS